jgi:hypothetical protein
MIISAMRARLDGLATRSVAVVGRTTKVPARGAPPSQTSARPSLSGTRPAIPHGMLPCRHRGQRAPAGGGRGGAWRPGQGRHADGRPRKTGMERTAKQQADSTALKTNERGDWPCPGPSHFTALSRARRRIGP